MLLQEHWCGLQGSLAMLQTWGVQRNCPTAGGKGLPGQGHPSARATLGFRGLGLLQLPTEHMNLFQPQCQRLGYLTQAVAAHASSSGGPWHAPLQITRPGFLFVFSITFSAGEGRAGRSYWEGPNAIPESSGMPSPAVASLAVVPLHPPEDGA